uniref:MC154R n=1 Tax=Rousettus bat poxvirus TaxID=3141933 RepID=A0AAU7E2S9_9POXV
MDDLRVPVVEGAVPGLAEGDVVVALPHDDVDLLLHAHTSKRCSCYGGYRGHLFMSGRQIRETLTEILNEKYTHVAESKEMCIPMCMKIMLRHDMSCFVYALRYACGYTSGLYGAVQMAKTCFCAHVYVGLEHAVPALTRSLERYISVGEPALGKVAAAIMTDAPCLDVADVLSAQSSVVSSTYAIMDAGARMHTFFLRMSTSIRQECACSLVDSAGCPHPVVAINNAAEESSRDMTRETILLILRRAENRLAALRKTLTKVARRCYRAGRLVEAAMRKGECAFPSHTSETFCSLARQRYHFGNCAYYAAIRDVIKTTSKIVVEVTDASVTVQGYQRTTAV